MVDHDSARGRPRAPTPVSGRPESDRLRSSAGAMGRGGANGAASGAGGAGETGGGPGQRPLGRGGPERAVGAIGIPRRHWGVSFTAASQEGTHRSPQPKTHLCTSSDPGDRALTMVVFTWKEPGPERLLRAEPPS
ncbi:uncharacterized protein LOC111181477 [Delphinapterus leucas]|uniref:Uncharacterized protein LOC111181477 n=1 Tax=Delphinapterus leucas TaxID=9749 RepID=A0A2Y9P639_DELLE|nr:uncharacterized protein LOC111181477 [Delphinapterus leucas]